MQWNDLFKIWKYATEPDPYTRRLRSRDIEGAGVTQPDAIPDIRADGSYWGGGRGVIKLRDSNDFIDLSSVTNRQSRYKEYERLRNVSEIETAMTVFADETCVSGDTLIATPTYGFITIKELSEIKNPNENFLVYCYDFAKKDFTLGWAFHPRLVKKAQTVRVCLGDGTHFICTPEHKVLLRNAEWIEAGNIKAGMDLMPFHRIRANSVLSGCKNNQFPRIYTLHDGWKNERQFIDEWRRGTKTEKDDKTYKVNRLIASGLNRKQISKMINNSWVTIQALLHSNGFSPNEIKKISKRYPERKKVIHVVNEGEQDVYDMSVMEHQNFATDTAVFHNCQLNEHNHMFEVIVKNQDVKEELEFLFFHPKMLNMDRKLWNIAKNLYIFGDHFMELIIDPEDPKAGVLRTQNLPADSVYRIETIKGKILEFQQSKEGPDYQSLARVEVTQASSADLAQATAIRFVPESIVHFRIGDDRRTFYPYGVSLIEPARGPAMQMRLMEDSMLVYRLCLTGDTHVLTSKGYKEIKDIEVDETVFTYYNDKLVPAKVMEQGKTGHKMVYEVKSKTTLINATDKHPVLVRNKDTGKVDYIEVRHIIPGIHQFVRVTIEQEIPKKIDTSESWDVNIIDKPIGKYEDIESIVAKTEQDVYDISVDHEAHNFIANGVVVHNSRAPERRVFYIDVGQLPPFKAESFISRLQDQFRKKKTYNQKGAGQSPYGAGPVEERWVAPSQDEDFWIPLRPNSATRVETLPGACLALDTKIPFLDGKVRTLAKAIEEFNAGEQLWVYSANPENGQPVPGRVTWAGVTRKQTQVVKVTLDNGESIICTPDHKFPVIGKGKVEAKDLTTGTSLIPFNTRMEKLQPNRPSLYPQIYDNSSKKFVFVHRLVANYLKGTKYENHIVFNEEIASKEKKYSVVHHANYNRLDNSPENLNWMGWEDHTALHRANQAVTNENISKALKEYHENMSDKDKKTRDEVLVPRRIAGTKALQEKLKDNEFKLEFEKNRLDKLSNFFNDKDSEAYKNRSKKVVERNKSFWSVKENKEKAFAKQTIHYPKELFDFVMGELAKNATAEDIAIKVRDNASLNKIIEEANAHLVRENIFGDGLSVDHIKKMFKQYGYESIRAARKAIGGHEKKSGRPIATWPKEIMDEFMKHLSTGLDVDEIIKIIDSNPLLMSKSNRFHFNRNVMNKMLKFFGYRGLKHARQHAALYNHKVVSVVWLDEKIDTGTLTIDGKEELHNYHNFAVSAGVVTSNSNLGEIDDALYFRNKLFIALNFPKNYMAQEDPQVTRMTLSSINVQFARLVERLQLSLSDGFTEIACRHLELRGFPPELYEDLQIKMTPPSHYREIAENEVIEARFNRALAVKGSQLFADLDILTRILKIPLDEAKEITSRATIQKVKELELQVMGQNPQLMGIALPGPGANEMGMQAGGPTGGMDQPQPAPAAGPGEAEAGGEAGGEAPPPQIPSANPPLKSAMDTYGKPKKAEGRQLPEPSEEDIRLYDLDIDDYSKGLDDEEIDVGELDDF